MSECKSCSGNCKPINKESDELVKVSKQLFKLPNKDGQLSDLELYVHASGEISVYFSDYDKPLFSGEVDINDILKIGAAMIAYKEGNN